MALAKSYQERFNNEEKVREKYPQLFQFFGGYFHQDWDLEFSANINQAISAYIQNQTLDRLNETKTELIHLLDQKLDESSLKKLFTILGCCYQPSSYQDFLNIIVSNF